MEVFSFHGAKLTTLSDKVLQKTLEGWTEEAAGGSYLGVCIGAQCVNRGIVLVI